MATINAVSANYVHVNLAVSQASTGDTVNVPAGNVMWSQTLALGNKGINLLMAGIGQTVIDNQAGMLISADATGSSTLRISGFTSNNQQLNNTQTISLRGPIFNARIDHVKFNHGNVAIGTNHFLSPGTGPVYGVADHCQFVNMTQPYYALDVRVNDGFWGRQAWAEFELDRASFVGSNKMWFIEDSDFLWDGALLDDNAQGAIYGEFGGKVCFRHNTCNGLCFYIDAHGDHNGPEDPGTIYYDVYNNTLVENLMWCNQGVLFFQRGGTWLVHDNTCTQLPGRTPCELTVYFETDAAAHRIQDTHFWGNSINGDTDQSHFVFVADSGQTSPGYAAAHLHVNVDYFLHEPQSGEHYFPYTSYTYPHPLQNGGDIVVSTPMIASGSQLFAPSMTYDQNVAMPTIAAGTVLYPMLVGDDTLTPISLESAPAINSTVMYAPTLEQSVSNSLSGSFIGPTSVLYTPLVENTSQTPTKNRLLRVARENRTVRVKRG